MNIFPQFWHPFNHNQTTLVSVLHQKSSKLASFTKKKHQQTWVFLTWTCWGPQLTATTSVTSFFSLSLTASSTAISQKGFIECLTPSVTTPVWSGLTRIWGGQRQSWNFKNMNNKCITWLFILRWTFTLINIFSCTCIVCTGRWLSQGWTGGYPNHSQPLVFK